MQSNVETCVKLDFFFFMDIFCIQFFFAVFFLSLQRDFPLQGKVHKEYEYFFRYYSTPLCPLVPFLLQFAIQIKAAAY